MQVVLKELLRFLRCGLSAPRESPTCPLMSLPRVSHECIAIAPCHNAPPRRSVWRPPPFPTLHLHFPRLLHLPTLHLHFPRDTTVSRLITSCGVVVSPPNHRCSRTGVPRVVVGSCCSTVQTSSSSTPASHATKAAASRTRSCAGCAVRKNAASMCCRLVRLAPELNGPQRLCPVGIQRDLCVC